MKIAIMGEIHHEGLKTLQKVNFDYFEITNFEENNLIKQLKDVDGILLRTAKLDENILSRCNNLKIISRHGVGYDNVDIKYLNQNKIALGITSTSNAVSVAEHVLTSFLYLTKNIHLSDQLTREGRFTDKSSLPNFFELYQKNVIIFGFGRIGRAVAKRCLGFESNVYIYDPFVSKKIIEENKCKVIDKIDGIKLADYISIHLPLNNKTKNFIGEKELSLMKKTAIIVNTARGGIVNEESLVKALVNKKILGAGLDVFEKEPPVKNHPLFSLDNIILSPHNAALTLECRKRMAIEAAENISFFLSNKQNLNLNNIVNKSELNL
ncbi:MAG: hydroxyacid dehydrogenase [Pelagibacteraceae bacterium]|nr:hydroxyacid dehydrogenase [Pelagibacteraceae bacterium]